MIIFRQNIPYPEDLKKLLMEDNFSEKYFDSDRNISTTFNKEIEYKNLGNSAREYYSTLMDSLVNVLGIYNHVQYSWHYWYQIYTRESSGHESHLHFSGPEILSWVHFISVSDNQAFYFETGEGKRGVAEKDGDLIVFPSWCIHGVNKIDSDSKRIVSAGNISLDYLSDPCGENNLSYDEKTNGYVVNPIVSLVKNERF